MESQNETKIRHASLPYFAVMLIAWPIIMAFSNAVEGEDVRVGVLVLFLVWWSLAAAGSILNWRKWKRLDLGSRFGIAVLGLIWIGPLVYFLYIGVIGIFHGNISL